MQYLLGQAGAEESSSFEERLITNKAFYDELTIAEDELIDQYLDGDLTEAEQKQFESHFLFSPERHQKVRFGRALHQAAGNADESQPVELIEDSAPGLPKPLPPSNFPLGMLWSNRVLSYSVLVLLAAAGIGLWVLWRKQSSVSSAGRIATITLLPGTTRSDRAADSRISNSADIETVQLRLALANPQDTHRVKVVDSDEKEIWSGDGVFQTDSGRSYVTANVPARLLPNGDYRVILSRKVSDGSFEEVLGYSFSVVP